MKTKLTGFEKYLEKKRGYVSRFPKNKKAVILYSGGLDSTITSARLMEDYNFELFPLHIQRGQTNGDSELKSVKFFTTFFQRKYGRDKFHTPTVINVNVPPIEFKDDLQNYMKKFGYPLRDTIMFQLGVEYAVAASEKHNNRIRTVFSANVFDDPFPHTTLLGIRVNNLNVCINTNDWGWLLTSLNIDPFLTKVNYGKVEEIKWASKNKIPIESTTSCYKVSEGSGSLSCGECRACLRRRSAFAKAGVQDPTKYNL